MKPGSLVECVWDFAQYMIGRYYLEKYPTKGQIYTVRDVVTTYDGCVTIRLTEIVNRVFSYDSITTECTFVIEGFRELVLPDDMEEAINELMMAPTIVEY